MSEEMAVFDNSTGQDVSSNNGENAVNSEAIPVEETAEQPSQAVEEPPSELPPQTEEPEPHPEVKEESQPLIELTEEQLLEAGNKREIEDKQTDAIKTGVDSKPKNVNTKDEKREIKRRALDAFSDDKEVAFKGFDDVNLVDLVKRYYNSVKKEDLIVMYKQTIERLEAEIRAANASFTPLRSVTASLPALPAPLHRNGTFTDGSRPSSALSSSSDDDPSASPARRTNSEMSSPLLRVPLERGWLRELVYRSTFDQHSRRNADIYYYSPVGKKLRSTREVAENLAGTGLTLENFSFFKKPLGIDDPEKEIIRNAKVLHRGYQAPTQTKGTKRRHSRTGH